MPRNWIKYNREHSKWQRMGLPWRNQLEASELLVSTCLDFIVKQKWWLNYMYIYCALNAVATHSAKTEFLRDYLPFAWQIWSTEIRGMLSVTKAITARAETWMQSKHYLLPAHHIIQVSGRANGSCWLYVCHLLGCGFLQGSLLKGCLLGPSWIHGSLWVSYPVLSHDSNSVVRQVCAGSLRVHTHWATGLVVSVLSILNLVTVSET